MVRAATELYEPSMLKLAPTFWAKPGKMGITVLWLASAKKMARLRSIISRVIPLFCESAILFPLFYGFKTHGRVCRGID
jgi:hypothetical protein